MDFFSLRAGSKIELAILSLQVLPISVRLSAGCGAIEIDVIQSYLRGINSAAKYTTKYFDGLMSAPGEQGSDN